MNTGNNYYMKKVNPTTQKNGIYYISKRILKFKQRDEFVTDDDLMHLFLGFVRLLKQTTEREIERKYINKILTLKKELKNLKEIKSVNS